MTQPQTRYCPTVRGDVPFPCPIRHRQHGCTCALDIEETAGVVREGCKLPDTKEGCAEAERMAREQMRDKAIRRRGEQQRLF